MIYYALRHVATGKLMPNSRLGAGYSHWNPPNGFMRGALNTPRLFTSDANARRARTLWVSMPNCTEHCYEDGTDITTKNDGRKLEDLEVITLVLTEVTI